MPEISNNDDIIDSRDVIARIQELKDAWSETTEDDFEDYHLSGDDLLAGLDEDEAAELTALLELAKEGEDYSGEWHFGETLIRDSHFEDYAQELAEDIGAVGPDNQWPLYCIDWERAADDLKMDYTEIDFDGVTYWVRS